MNQVYFLEVRQFNTSHFFGLAQCSKPGVHDPSTLKKKSVLLLIPASDTPPPFSSLLFSVSLPSSRAKSTSDILVVVFFCCFFLGDSCRKRQMPKRWIQNHQHSFMASFPSPPPLRFSLSRLFPITSLSAKLSPLFSSCFLLLRTCHRSPRHSLPSSLTSSTPPTTPPPCLPSLFRLFPLELTVPEGRGHLRTKWRISRQLCAHSLRWPSIIHCPPALPHHHPPPSVFGHALFICACRLPPFPLRCFFTLRLRVSLPPFVLASHLGPSPSLFLPYPVL